MIQSEKVLNAAIVDDEQDLCILLEKILKGNNFTTTSVNTLQDINKKLLPLEPVVIFLDNYLPDGSGICYIPQLKKDLPQAKIVMMTAYSAVNEEMKALKNGADLFLTKPLTKNIINNALTILHLPHSA